MKSLVKLLRYILIATIVVVGILYWQWNHPPENKLPAPTEVAAMPDQPAGQSLDSGRDQHCHFKRGNYFSEHF